MIALDASVLIALLNRDDRHHARAREVLLADVRFEVHPLNLAEALVAPARAGREARAMNLWRAAGVEQWTTADPTALALARLRVETRLRLPDCCPLLVAESTSRRVATFDRRLASAAASRGVEVLDADH